MSQGWIELFCECGAVHKVHNPLFDKPVCCSCKKNRVSEHGKMCDDCWYMRIQPAALIQSWINKQVPLASHMNLCGCMESGCQTCDADKRAMSSPVIPDNSVRSGLSFGEAMKAVAEGKRVRRKEWGSGWECALLAGMLRCPSRHDIGEPTTFRESDILATDWEVVE